MRSSLERRTGRRVLTTDGDRISGCPQLVAEGFPAVGGSASGGSPPWRLWKAEAFRYTPLGREIRDEIIAREANRA